MKVFQANASLSGLASVKLNVPYACPDGHELCMHVMYPQDIGQGVRHPLIVFLQGSGWTKPGLEYELPQLCRFAQHGYVVATIDHRHAREARGHLGFLEDTKSAIRFLRAHADEYGIDAERVCMWGTSSGGNTALLVGMTYDMPEFDVGENLDQSSRVQLVVDTFGPANLVDIVLARFSDRSVYEPENTFSYLADGFPGDNLAIFEKMSPMTYVGQGKALPPMLILNGDADELVTYESSLQFYEEMTARGYDVDFVKVENGPHEGSFWSPELFDYIRSYIDVKLK